MSGPWRICAGSAGRDRLRCSRRGSHSRCTMRPSSCWWRTLSAWQVLFARSLIVLPFCLCMRRRARPNARVAWPVRRASAAQCGGLRPGVDRLLFGGARPAARRARDRLFRLTDHRHRPGGRSPRRARAPSRWVALGRRLRRGPSGLRAGELSSATAVWLALVAAALWALSVVLMRQLSATCVDGDADAGEQLRVPGAVPWRAPWWWRRRAASSSPSCSGRARGTDRPVSSIRGHAARTRPRWRRRWNIPVCSGRSPWAI